MRILCAVVLASVLAVAAPAQAQTRIAVIVVDFASSDPAPSTNMDVIRRTMGDVEAFYLEQSYHRFSFTSDVWGPYRVDDSTVLAATSGFEARRALAMIARQAASDDGVDVSVYDGFVYVSPVMPLIAGGYGDRSGVWIAIAWYPTIRFQIAAHELGHHLFSLPHAEAAGDTGGSSIDVMGAGSGHFNAITKDRLGWMTESERQIATTDGDYFLTPFETVGGVKTLILTGGTQKAPRTYYVEYRQAIGFDAYLPLVDPSNLYHGAVVHLDWFSRSILQELTPTSNGRADTPALLVGQTWCEGGRKLSLRTVSATPEGLWVRVSTRHCR